MPGEIFEELSQDSRLNCIVITGAGGKAFGSGNDISEFARFAEMPRKCVPTMILQLLPFAPLKIAGIQPSRGSKVFVWAAGLSALACDIRLAAPNSIFGLPVKNMGIFLDPALADTLVNVIGRTAALELVLEGRFMDAKEAFERRLITRIADDDLDSEVAATVDRICAGAPLAHRFNKEAIRKVRIEGDESEEQYSLAASYGDTVKITVMHGYCKSCKEESQVSRSIVWFSSQ